MTASSGSSWGNYTDSFQTQIVDNQSGWFVRGQDAGDGYAFILDDSTDTAGTANQLQEFDVSDGNYNSTDAATYASDAAALKTAINDNLYDSPTGLYYLSNTSTTTVAQDANSLAVLYGVAPAPDDTALLAALKTDLWTTPYGPEPFTGSTYSNVISPYVTGYEVDASLSANDTADAESLLETVWGDMINPSNPEVRPCPG